jgi:methionine-gamma-lyase
LLSTRPRARSIASLSNPPNRTPQKPTRNQNKTVLDPADLERIFRGERGPDRGGCYLYGRSFSPTVRVLSRALAAMEGTEAAYATSSGMAAISTTLLALCDAGDRVVCSSAVYGGTHALLKSFLPLKCRIETTFVDITDLEAVEGAVRGSGPAPAAAKVLFCEAVANPTLVVADLPALAAIAHRHGAKLVVDNTFTPLTLTPAHHGADVVVHSGTKFLSGASDMIVGAICGDEAFVASLMDLHLGPVMLLGPTLDPRVAAELASRLAHLPLRVLEHARRALALASRLEKELGAKVVYPGLRSHSQHELFLRLANKGDGDDDALCPTYGYGGIFGLEMTTTATPSDEGDGQQAGSSAHRRAEALMQRLQNKHAFGLVAVSLGYSETLMSLSALSTSSELSAEELTAAKIGEGYIRFSVGITGSLERRWGQLREAYTFVTRHWKAAGGASAAAAATAAVAEGGLPFLATRVLRDRAGVETDAGQWPSSGSELEREEEEEEGGDGGGGGGAMLSDTSDGNGNGNGNGAAKVRRVASDMLIRYTPLACGGGGRRRRRKRRALRASLREATSLGAAASRLSPHVQKHSCTADALMFSPAAACKIHHLIPPPQRSTTQQQQQQQRKKRRRDSWLNTL